MHADSVGLALLVVLETLEPAERLAFLLHDVFGMTVEIDILADRSVSADSIWRPSTTERERGMPTETGRG